jgi:hypothetical protein
MRIARNAAVSGVFCAYPIDLSMFLRWKAESRAQAAAHFLRQSTALHHGMLSHLQSTRGEAMKRTLTRDRHKPIVAREYDNGFCARTTRERDGEHYAPR